MLIAGLADRQLRYSDEAHSGKSPSGDAERFDGERL